MEMLPKGKDRLVRVEKLLLDGGYNGKPSADLTREHLDAEALLLRQCSVSLAVTSATSG